jgi:hypothetical protein
MYENHYPALCRVQKKTIMKTQVTINVDLSKVDLEHMMVSVLDALYLPENVTQEEYNLVSEIINQLIKTKEDADEIENDGLAYTTYSGRYAKGGGVGVFNSMDTLIRYELINLNGEIVYVTFSMNEASDYRVINGKHLKIQAVDKSGNKKMLYANGG